MKAAMPEKVLKRKLPPPSVLNGEPDWPWIKRQYRAGQLSTREIARRSTAKGGKVSHVAIEKRAHKEGWTDDLAPEVRRRLQEKLVATVTKDGATNEEIVEAAATEGVSVVQSHRKDIKTAASLARTMFTELKDATENLTELREAIDAVEKEKDPKKKARKQVDLEQRARLMKMIGLPARAGVLRELTQSMRLLIGLERQAFNIDARHEGATLEDYLKSLDE